MRWLRVGLVPLLALTLSHVASAEQHGGDMPQHHPMTMDDSGRQEMMEEMQARQQKLDDLVAAMEGAEGQAKVDAIADVVKELVAQRRAMSEHMQEMHGQMMESMHPGRAEVESESAPSGHAH